MGSDYDKGYRGEAGVETQEYLRGVADQQYATPREDAVTGSYSPPVTVETVDTWGTLQAAASIGAEYREGKVRFYLKWLAQTAGLSTIAAAIGAGLAIFSQKSGQEALLWALAGAGVAVAFSMVVLAAFTFGLLIGYGLRLVFLPLILWRWLLAFGALGAAAGYGLALMASESTALATQQAIDFGVRGLAVGFALGVVYRMLRWARRRGAPKRSTGAA